jgi:hypothetical protein
MTVGELMGLLEDQPEDAVVRIVHQQSWPLQEVVGGVANSRDIVDEDQDEEEAISLEDSDETSIVYLVANGHPTNDSPYGARGAWGAMRRSW